MSIGWWGHPAVVQLLPPLIQAGAAISIITFGEIYEGIYYSRDPERAENGFRNFLRGVEVLPLNRTTMKCFARIRGDLRRRGNLISDPDLLIAATALTRGLILVTRNRRHFQPIPGLSIYPLDHGPLLPPPRGWR